MSLNKIVEEIDECMERVYQKKPDWRPNAGFEVREMNSNIPPFNFDVVDEDYERIMDQEFCWGEARELNN